jgi:hypothetical protein
MKKIETRKLSAADALSEAFSEITSLGEEMREAFDNTPEVFQSSEVGTRREEAADALESISEVEAPEYLADVIVTAAVRKYGRRGPSRAARHDDATALMSMVIDVIREIEDTEADDDRRTELSDLADEIEAAKDTADAVEFPGAYGR